MRRLVVLFFVGACATTGASGQGDLNLPSEGLGPFRKLTGDEVAGVAPFVFDDATAMYREPAVLAEGDGTLLYLVASLNGADVIARTRSDDGRAFYGATTDYGHDPAIVLRADQPWEGGALSGPFALRTDQGITLYYAAAGGIGAATSSDGLTFTKVPGPILAKDPASSWETTELRAPAVYVMGDRVRLLYASGGALGEAESTGGPFTRLGADPILLGADDPCPSAIVTPAGRAQLRVLYTGVDGTIRLAGRYDDAGPLETQETPIYSVNAGERAPALLTRGTSTYLYVQQNRKLDATHTYPAIAAAYAPSADHLPAPLPFPDGP